MFGGRAIASVLTSASEGEIGVVKRQAACRPHVGPTRSAAGRVQRPTADDDPETGPPSYSLISEATRFGSLLIRSSWRRARTKIRRPRRIPRWRFASRRSNSRSRCASTVDQQDAAATAARLTTPPPADTTERLSGRGHVQQQRSDMRPSVLHPADGHRQREEAVCNTGPATLRQQRRGIEVHTVLNEQRTQTDRTTTTSAENCPIHVRLSHLTRPVANTLQGSEDGRPTTVASRLIGLSTRYSNKRMSCVSARLAHGRQFSTGQMLRPIVREPERGRLRCPGIARLPACQAAMVRRVPDGRGTLRGHDVKRSRY